MNPTSNQPKEFTELAHEFCDSSSWRDGNWSRAGSVCSAGPQLQQQHLTEVVCSGIYGWEAFYEELD